MKFKLRPVVSEIRELYSKPISYDRFRSYLAMLEGDSKGDMILPIAGFNPMAKDHVLQKIGELVDLQAENIIEEVIEAYNADLDHSDPTQIDVVLNLADALKGGWTNFYTTDFDSKFRISAYVTRNFCIPYFWTSEDYSEQKIRRRTREYLSRTHYWKTNPRPETLSEHLLQEVFVARDRSTIVEVSDSADFRGVENFYSEYRNSDNYSVIFNFFYGDKASESLSFKKHGITEKTGFDYAQLLARRNRAK